MNKKVQRKYHEKVNQKMLREYTPIAEGMSILLGNYSQNNYKFSKASRNNQSIPNAIAAIVMSRIEHPKAWTNRNINVILDSGDVLYKDSWFYYKPYYNPNLGLANVLRTIRIENYKVTTKIYRSAVIGELIFSAFYIGLLNFFLHEISGIVCTEVYNIAVFQRDGNYYLVDPYDRNETGGCAHVGLACVLRFADVKIMAEKIYDTVMNQGRILKKTSSENMHLSFSIHGVSIEKAISIPAKINNVNSCQSCTSKNYIQHLLHYKPVQLHNRRNF